MDDLISRDYLREIVGGMSTEWEYGAAVSDIYNIIMKAPAVDAVPVVHGRWIYKKYDGNGNNIRVYGDKVYIFHDAILITVLNVPPEHRKQAKWQQKKVMQD